MESFYSNILQMSIVEITMISSPAVVMVGYLLYSCCSPNKEINDELVAEETDVKTDESESLDCDNINAKNSKLAFMLMMLLSVEPKLNTKYIQFAKNIGYDHIIEDIAREYESEPESE